jgi:hypothetical protein
MTPIPKLPLNRTWPLLIAIALTLAACEPIPDSFKSPNMTELSPRLKPVFEKTKTICIGRLLIDVPESATVVYGRAWAPSYFDLVEGGAKKVTQLVDKEEAKFRSSLQYPPSKGVTNFKETVSGATPGQKIVVGYQEGMLPNIYAMTSFAVLGDDLFVQEGGALTGVPDGDASSLSTVIAGLNDVASNLRPRAADEIPSDPGVCIDGAFIADNPALTHEMFPLGIRLKEFPDVHFSIRATRKNQVVPSDALEVRLAKAKKAAEAEGFGALYARNKFLRRGERQIEGWPGSEALVRRPAHDGKPEHHQFLFMSQGEPKNALKPVLDIQMDTGVEGNEAAGRRTSLTDEEAIALWDKLTSTIRVRPTGGAPARKTSDAGPLLPLGELAATGRTCPQTGVWECVDEGAVQGGRRQMFRAGETMPGIVRTVEPTMWQKLKGESPAYRSATVWKLVDYGTAPPA